MQKKILPHGMNTLFDNRQQPIDSQEDRNRKNLPRVALLSLLAAGASAIPGAAMADITSNGSDITIYGKIRSSWDYVTYDQASGVDDVDDDTAVFRSSYLGFKGTEALTSDLAGIWQVETHLHTDKNVVQLRNTFVGLQHDKWGEIIFGKHATPYRMNTNKLDIFQSTIADNNNIMGAHLVSNDIDGDGNADKSEVGVDVMLPKRNFDERASNLVMYQTPKFHGLRGQLSRESFSRPEDDSDDEYEGFSGAVIYDRKPYYAAVAYEMWEGDGNRNATGRDKVDAWNFAAGYTFGNRFGKSKICFIYEDIDHGEQNSTMSRSAFWTGFSHRIGANEFKIAYAAADDSEASTRAVGGNDDGADNLSIGIEHHFSKRTRVYAIYTHMDNDEHANYGLFKQDNTWLGASTGINSFYAHTGANGKNIDSISLGISHGF
uniref:Outer membrane protein (Porin) n=2 Tax=Candidatus Kentrum sp. FM TaxID=2126340 RepID=A0A450WCJ5_9GAMM|nr:MAG: Outer membrane protein (porin) [Candidatus Kentron sp. FM]